MKKAILILVLCLALGGALAETTEPTPTPTPLQSSAEDFLSSLTGTWDAFMNMAGEAGKVASQWGEDASRQIDGFLQENMPELKAWLDEANSYFSENVSPELNEAWNTLKENAAEFGTHTQQEVEKAYAAIEEWMKSNNPSEEVRDAVNEVAEAAGVDSTI